MLDHSQSLLISAKVESSSWCNDYWSGDTCPRMQDQQLRSSKGIDLHSMTGGNTALGPQANDSLFSTWLKLSNPTNQHNMLLPVILIYLTLIGTLFPQHPPYQMPSVTLSSTTHWPIYSHQRQHPWSSTHKYGRSGNQPHHNILYQQLDIIWSLYYHIQFSPATPSNFIHHP